jgi:uncharacterized C2H2 Zn-finger protein
MAQPTQQPLHLGRATNDDGMAIHPHHHLSFCSPHHNHFLDAAEVYEQQAHVSEPEVTGAKITTCPSLAKSGPSSIPRARKQKASLQLKCDFEGCTHRGTFSRESDLRRHTRSKHPRADAGSFVCRAEGCFNRQLPWTFTRSDKLTSHIKAVHTRDTVFTACPVSRCDFGRCTLETLGVHLVRGHLHGGSEVLNASTCKVRKCPLWHCDKHLKARDLPGHVTGHAKYDVLAAIPELEHEGLVVLSTSVSSQQGHTYTGLTIAVQCPMCNTMSDDIDQFITHLWSRHVFLAGSGGADHFVAWRSTLIENAPSWQRSGLEAILPWTDCKSDWYLPKSGVNTIQCPSCSLPFSFRGNHQRNAAMAHLFSPHLLRPEAEGIAELYPHRMQILRLYPEFVSHPVFADFDKTQKDALSSSQERSQLADAEIMEGVKTHGHAMADLNTPF